MLTMLRIRTSSEVIAKLRAVCNQLLHERHHSKSGIHYVQMSAWAGNRRKWRPHKIKEPKMDPELFKGGEPVSGSANNEEDLSELYNQPFELRVAELSKNGYLRFQKPYQPRPDTQSKLLALVKTINPKLSGAKLSEIIDYKINDLKFKYDLLSKAFDEFDHAVPNSMLYLMETIGDVVQFYNTPVETTTPYEDLSNTKDLPPNLHVQKEAVRFTPETDTAFGGITAFPRTTTIITGLRARKKYKGQQAKIKWPYV